MLKKLKVSWHKAFLHLIPLGGFSHNNHVTIFHEGDAAFLSIIESINGANHSIYLETYILANDRIGLWLRDALIAARGRGTRITILYDHVGSAGLANSFLKPMTDAGIKVLGFNPIWVWRRKGPLLFRDHRKIIVIDEQIAFCGSMNMSADYAGPLYGTDRYRDSIAIVRGPAVKDLLKITLESIAESEFDREQEAPSIIELLNVDKKEALKLFFRRLVRPIQPLKPSQQSDGTLVQVLRSNMRRNLTHIQKSMEESVNRAVEYCYFTTPYFLPHQALKKALINARRRGVDVRILSAGLSDVPLMRSASRHVYKELLQHDIRIYEMTQKTLHAKLATIDNIYASIGSYNLDHWSARRNLEVNLSFIDPEIAQELKKQFETDLTLSQEINKTEFLARSLVKHVWCWMAYLLLML